MNLYKRLITIIVICLVIILLTSSCKGDDSNKWYRINAGGSAINEITISEKTPDGFYLEADCSNGANTGKFAGNFKFLSNNIATLQGQSWDGKTFHITITFYQDTIKIEIDGNDSESNLLGLGNAVTMSGEYSQTKPVYDYFDYVLENVFQGDIEMYNSVNEFLGDEKFASFVNHFGISFIDTYNELGYEVITGRIRGIRIWCAFCATSDGFFYGLDNNAYFSNDPMYKDSPPIFFEKLDVLSLLE